MPRASSLDRLGRGSSLREIDNGHGTAGIHAQARSGHLRRGPHEHHLYADWGNGKEYRIKINSPEHVGLQKLMKKDGGSWDPEDQEYGAMIQYFKDHATTVADVLIRLDRQ